MTKKPLQTRARMQDVARAAGVSNATVSRVLNGNKPVWPELHERVIKAALELGFDLTRRNDSRIVAFLLSNRPVLHPFHSNVLVGAEAHCAAKDFGVLFHRLQYSLKATPQEIHIPQVLLNRKIVQGVIVAGTNSRTSSTPWRRGDCPWFAWGITSWVTGAAVSSTPCFLMTLAAPATPQVTCSL